MVSAELYGAVSAPLLDVTLSSTMDHHGRDVFEGVLEEAEWMVTPELRERFEEECRFFRDTGYDSALAELICNPA